MKFKNLFFAAIAAAFLSSAMSPDTELTTGSTAPTIERVNGEKMTLKNGKDKVICFWSPKDPMSRINNKQFSERFKEEGVELISICIDSDDSLAKAVLDYDGTANYGKHLVYSDVNDRVFKDYGVEEAPATFIVAADGKIKERI